MKKYFLGKTIRLIISLLVFSLILHALLRLSLGDPTLGFLRRHGIENASANNLLKVRSQLGIENNFLYSYFQWLTKCLKGDFGVSFIHEVPVSHLFLNRLCVSLNLILPTFFVEVLGSLFLGHLLGSLKREWLYINYTGFLAVLLSMPVYFSSLLLIYLLGITWPLFPFVGSQTSKHIVLPVLSLFLSEGIYLIKVSADLYHEKNASNRIKIAKYRKIKKIYPWC
ncbi:ABC transporter permease [Streptococcus ictaluri]|uniref:ABC transporter, permease protein n=1 Tax=Streptococcus ictaluri 707-05 TaxID=764299 RepID=G5K354_9STRE|nr:ABC transporter permease [Streptococcus ictaluri]EHI69572.1 hypothetical protein STRIC_1222 [Streptococcus ictaluri 707-05]